MTFVTNRFHVRRKNADLIRLSLSRLSIHLKMFFCSVDVSIFRRKTPFCHGEKWMLIESLRTKNPSSKFVSPQFPFDPFFFRFFPENCRTIWENDKELQGNFWWSRLFIARPKSAFQLNRKSSWKGKQTTTTKKKAQEMWTWDWMFFCLCFSFAEKIKKITKAFWKACVTALSCCKFYVFE